MTTDELIKVNKDLINITDNKNNINLSHLVKANGLHPYVKKFIEKKISK